MSSPDAHDTLGQLLGLTREEEMDCEAFAERIAAYADGSIKTQRVLELMDHHCQVCPECAEELAILKQALAGD